MPQPSALLPHPSRHDRPAPSPAETSEQAPGRLRSLDAFRGLTIAAMVVVESSGSPSNTYAALRHAGWNGWTPADLVFPFFLYIVGAAMALSFARRHQDGGTGVGLGRILRRGLLLVGAGLLLNGFPWVLGSLRVPGVLQRIGVTYVLASLIVLRLPLRRQFAVGSAILLGYWAAIALVPVPGVGAPAMTPAHSLPGWLDVTLLGRSHLYGHGTYDPEGLLSTLPAVVTVLLGYWSGEWLRRRARVTRTVLHLLIAGGALAVAGAAWATVLPANKRLWTSSFVLLTAGLAAAVLALCFWAVDVARWRRLGQPFEVMGLNAIAVYVASEVGGNLLAHSLHPGGASLRDLAYAHVVAWTTPARAALAIAVGVLAWWWVVAYAMYRRRWFLKI